MGSDPRLEGEWYRRSQDQTLVEKDLVQALKWYRKASGQKSCDGYGAGYDKIFKYVDAAEQGDVRAMCRLGECYYKGEILEEDAVQAVKWFRKAAQRGNAKAMYYLGVCYQLGAGVEQDRAQAVEWWRKAAQRGDAEAQYEMGTCYEYGYGVKKDVFLAKEWYEKAAAQGEDQARSRLYGQD